MLKILKASSYYEPLVKILEKKISTNLSYVQYLDELHKQNFAESNFFKLNIEQLGNYQVEELIINSEILQKKWAFENDFSFSNKNWYFEILEAQIIKFKPTVFFAHDRTLLSQLFIDNLRKKLPDLKLVITWDGVDSKDYNLIHYTDIVFTPADFITKNYQSNGIKSYTLPFGFEKTILPKLFKTKLQNDVSFVGSVFLGKGAHIQRKDILMELIKNNYTDLNLTGTPDIFNNLFSKQTLALIKNSGLQGFIEAYQLFRVSKGSLFGMDMYQKFYNSKIIINSHIDLSGNNAGNIRLFEATGVGSCLLTDYKENLSEFFEIDKEIVVFKNKIDLIEKIDFLLNNESKRKEIALAGQYRTLTNYNYLNRAKVFISIIEKHLR
jgi:spore maturation protein CgeB